MKSILKAIIHNRLGNLSYREENTSSRRNRIIQPSSGILNDALKDSSIWYGGFQTDLSQQVLDSALPSFAENLLSAMKINGRRPSIIIVLKDRRHYCLTQLYFRTSKTNSVTIWCSKAWQNWLVSCKEFRPEWNA